MKVYLLSFLFICSELSSYGQNSLLKRFIFNKSANCVTKDSANFYIAGGFNEGILIKTDNIGKVLFAKNYNTGTSLFSINDILYSNGFIYIVGFTTESLSPINNYKNYFVAKIDTGNGSIINSIVGGGLYSDQLSKLALTDNNQLTILGYSNYDSDSIGSMKGIIINVSSDLVVINSKQFDILSGNIQFNDIVKIANFYYVLGVVSFNGVNTDDVIVCKFDSSFNLLSHKINVTEFSEISWSIRNYNNDIWIVGDINDWLNSSFFANIFLMHMDTTLNLSSFYRINVNQPIGEAKLFEMNSELYINSHGYIFKLDGTGNILSCKNLNVITSSQVVENNKIAFSLGGNYGVLLTDTSFYACSVTSPNFGPIPLTSVDSTIAINSNNNNLVNITSISESSGLYIDSLICSFVNSEYEAESNFKYRLFPCPAKDVINLMIDKNNLSPLAIINFIMYDINGREILSTVLKGNDVIDISEFSNGFYVGRIIFDNYEFHEKITILN